MTTIKINLKNNYKTVQEGERILEITSAKFTPSGKPNKLQLNMKDIEDGGTLLNSYNFDNDTSVWAMGMMLSIALGLEDGDNFDTKDVEKLVGVKLKCEVTHSEYNDKVYANVRKIIEKVEVDEAIGVVEESSTNDDLSLEQIENVLYSRAKLTTNDDLD